MNFIELDKETKFKINQILNDGELFETDVELLEKDEEIEELNFDF